MKYKGIVEVVETILLRLNSSKNFTISKTKGQSTIRIKELYKELKFIMSCPLKGLAI